MNDLVPINNHTLVLKEYQGERIVTFKDIDECHERPEGTARKSFNRNRVRFIEGVDYFTVKPSDIEKSVKHSFEIRNGGDIQMSVKRTSEINNRGTIFLAESGYLMLVKPMNDDLSWQVQRMMVNSYFRANALPQIGTLLTEMKTQLKEELLRELLNPAAPGRYAPKVPYSADAALSTEVIAYLSAIRSALKAGFILVPDGRDGRPLVLNVNPEKVIGKAANFVLSLRSDKAYSIYLESTTVPCTRQGLYALLHACGLLIAPKKKSGKHGAMVSNGYIYGRVGSMICLDLRKAKEALGDPFSFPVTTSAHK